MTRHLSTLEKDQEVIRFFDQHRWMLSDPRFAAEARRQVKVHKASLARTRAKLAATKAALRKRRQTRELAVLRRASPPAVICKVFGRYCKAALAVSRCESNLTTGAHNGEYLGLFQMGSDERRLFGHGESALEQVQAAYRYFVASGYDWSPWSCKPWA